MEELQTRIALAFAVLPQFTSFSQPRNSALSTRWGMILKMGNLHLDTRTKIVLHTLAKRRTSI